MMLARIILLFALAAIGLAGCAGPATYNDDGQYPYNLYYSPYSYPYSYPPIILDGGGEERHEHHRR